MRSFPERDEDPVVVTQISLDETAIALKTGNARLMVSWFSAPYRVETYDSVRILETEDELVRLFDEVREFYDANGITDLHRRCVAASRRGDDEILATHETRLLHDTRLVADPYPSLSTMRWIDGRWMVTGTSYGADRDSALSQLLAGTRAEQKSAARRG